MSPLISTYDDRYIQNHIRNLTRRGSPKRINQLTQRRSERIRQRRERRRAGTSTIREPQITVPCRSAEAKGLREADQDLPEHGETEDAAILPVRSGARVPDPVADQY